MSTPEGHPPKKPTDISHLLGELAGKLSAASEQETAQGTDAPSGGLSRIASTLRGAAVRTGAADLLYDGDGAPEAATEVAATPSAQTPARQNVPGTALNQSDALAAIMGDFQELQGSQPS